MEQILKSSEYRIEINDLLLFHMVFHMVFHIVLAESLGTSVRRTI